jgi:molybdopterin-guanine dinucleotide biosynthesis protein A
MKSKVSPTLTAAIIAGGKSRRFGSPKALAILGKQTLIDYAIHTARAISEEIVISYGEDNLFADKSIPVVQDIIPDCGPLGGIYSVLLHAKTSWVAVLPCDLPLLNAQIYEALFAACQKNRPVVALSERGVEPLVSIWPQSLSKTVGKFVRSRELALHKVVHELDAVEVDIPNQLPDYRAEIFLNVNREEDLDRIRKIVHENAAPASD